MHIYRDDDKTNCDDPSKHSLLIYGFIKNASWDVLLKYSTNVSRPQLSENCEKKIVILWKVVLYLKM